ncbi:MAG: 30S ribosomal protein S6 [Cyanobacteria bacterium P01_A01_bin.135]
MNSYETMYILRPNLGEEDTTQIIETYQNMLTDNGAEEITIQHRGKRRLAYEIDRNREGIYVQMNYRAPGDAIAIMQRAMRLSESVLRFLTIKQELVEAAEEDTEDAAMAR